MIIDNILDALDNLVDVLVSDTADGDSAVLGHVDAVVLDHGLRLSLSEASEGEQADLGGDVGPVTLYTLVYFCTRT